MPFHHVIPDQWAPPLTFLFFIYNCLGYSLRKIKQASAFDKHTGLNIVVNAVVNTVVRNENGESSKERPKPAAVKNKNNALKPNNKSEEKKGKTKQSAKEDVGVKIPRKSNVAQARNLRKRSNAEPAAEEKPDKTCTKCIKYTENKATQVTLSMIDNDEELCKINSQHSDDKASVMNLKIEKNYVSIRILYVNVVFFHPLITSCL